MKKIYSKDLKPLKTFVQDYPECTPFLLYRGKERLKSSGINCVPSDEFLKNLTPLRKIGD